MTENLHIRLLSQSSLTPDLMDLMPVCTGLSWNTDIFYL